MKVDKVYASIKENDRNFLMAGLVSRAAEFFEGFEDDFCLQHVAAEAIIFGGSNRVVWHVRSGWRCENSQCSPEFIAHYKGVIA